MNGSSRCSHHVQCPHNGSFIWPFAHTRNNVTLKYVTVSPIDKGYIKHTCLSKIKIFRILLLLIIICKNGKYGNIPIQFLASSSNVIWEKLSDPRSQSSPIRTMYVYVYVTFVSPASDGYSTSVPAIIYAHMLLHWTAL